MPLVGAGAILEGILTGLGGLAQVLNQGARQRQENELKGATLLAQTGDYSFQPVTDTTSQGILGAIFGTSPTTIGGEQVIMLGGKPYSLKPYGTINQAQGVGTARPPGGLSGLGTAPAPSNLRLTPESMVPEPAVQYPSPATAPTLPPATTPVASLPQTSGAGVMAQPSTAVQQALTRASNETGIPLEHLYGVSAIESGFDPNAVGPVTKYGWQAKGLMQLSPDTGKRFGVENFHDANENALGGALAWKEALQKANGDARVAYQQYYNPGASNQTTNQVLTAINRFKALVTPTAPAAPSVTTGTAAAGTPSVTDVGGAATPAPSVAAPTTQAPPLPAPPTATSTLAQDAAYRAANQQQAGVQPAPSAPVPPTGIATSSAETATAASPPAPTSTPTAAPQTQAPATPATPAVEPPQSPAQKLTTQAVAKARQTPGQTIVDTPYGPMLVSQVPQFEKQVQDLGDIYRANPTGRATYNEKIREAAKDLVTQTEKFQAYRDQTIKAHPYAETALRQARTWGELNTMAESIPAADVQQLMYARVMDVASKAGDQKQLIGPVIAQYAAQGMTDAMQKRAEQDSGYAKWLKEQEVVGVERAKIQPGVEKIQAEAGPLAAATAQSKRAALAEEGGFNKEQMVEAQKMVTETGIPIPQFTPQMRTTVVERAGTQTAQTKGKETAAVLAERQKASADMPATDRYYLDRVLASPKWNMTYEDYLKTADDPTKRNALFNDIRALQTDDTNFKSLNTIVSADKIHLWGNRETGEVPPDGMLPKDLYVHGFIPMSEKTRGSIAGINKAMAAVDRTKILMVGGTVPDDSFGIPAGTVFPGILPALKAKENASVVQRFMKGAEIKGLNIAGSDISEWAKTYENIRPELAITFSRGGLGDVGRRTMQEVTMMLDAFGQTGLKSWLQQSPSQAEKGFAQLKGILVDNKRAVAPPSSMPAMPTTVPQGQPASWGQPVSGPPPNWPAGRIWTGDSEIDAATMRLYGPKP